MTSPQGTDPMLGPALALLALRAEHPELKLTSARVDDAGNLELAASSHVVFTTLAEILGAYWTSDPFTYAFKGRSFISETLTAKWRDITVRVVVDQPIADDTYAAFVVDHDPDPLNWPPQEKAEFAQFALRHTLGTAA